MESAPFALLHPASVRDLATVPSTSERNRVVIAEHPWATFVEILDGEDRWAVLETGGDSAMAVAHAEGHLLLVRNRRHGAGVIGWELPGGCVDAGESPAKAAQRELAEETGIRVAQRKVKPLGSVFANAAQFNQATHLFFIDALTVQPVAVSHESLDVAWFRVETVVAAAARGLITDAATNTAILRARVRGLI